MILNCHSHVYTVERPRTILVWQARAVRLGVGADASHRLTTEAP